MAWVKIKGSNEKYQYGNTAPGRSTYKNSARGDNSVISDGIRTYQKLTMIVKYNDYYNYKIGRHYSSYYC